MVSLMAKEDVHALEKKGVKLTFEEIVKLNALGVRCEQNPYSSSFYALPRCAFLGDENSMIVFREPTIGQETWFQNVLQLFSEDDDTTMFLLRAYSMKMGVDLPEWSDPKAVREAIRVFIEKDMEKFTVGQVMGCVNYCLYGSSPNDDEVAETPQSDEEKKDDEEVDLTQPPSSIVIGYVHEAQAMRLGISLEDAMKMTKSEIQAVIHRAKEIENRDLDKDLKNSSIQEYYSTLEIIKQRHAQEKEEVTTNGQ